MSATVFRSLLLVFSSLVIAAFLAVFLVTYSTTHQLHWELLVHASVITVVIWIIAKAPSQRPSGRCPACGSRVFPTRRSIDSARLWTCSGCGFEIPRTWSRPRPAGDERPPAATAEAQRPNQPGTV